MTRYRYGLRSWRYFKEVSCQDVTEVAHREAVDVKTEAVEGDTERVKAQGQRQEAAEEVANAQP